MALGGKKLEKKIFFYISLKMHKNVVLIVSLKVKIIDISISDIIFYFQPLDSWPKEGNIG